MRFFAIGQEAEGFIAIGQVATGVIAIGQMATGVIAIGQVARGVVAVGMLAFGCVTLGMLSVGLVYSVGMVGAGGRAGPGLILPLVPVPKQKAKVPELTSLDAIRASRQQGWIEVALRTGASGMPELVHQGAAIAATLPAKLLGAATTAARMQAHAVALVVPSGASELRVSRMMQVPSRGIRPLGALLQIGILFVVAAAYWQLVLVELGDFTLAAIRDLVTGGLS